MKIRLTCLPEEAPRALEQLDAAFEVDEKDRASKNRGRSRQGRLYLDVRLRTVEITADVASHVLWHFGELGKQPGSFVRDLIMLVARADPPNRARLGLGHPAYVLAVSLAQAPDGVATLQAIAAGETATTL